ncbi:M10 family metallopeptidase C-terminal domain-containing protein [Pararhizobium arenae]|uniref:M10 family metallopeptidase C-terminal domain-containing protein n=1 Tax=Pararhizobium arenae TaxID=1856850 RepID=UPI00094ABB00|nr:M10 family metallopeptidase C-terminal domain-containing protein [Pararhizobium arenae]
MSKITKNTSVTLNGSTSFKLGTDTYTWDDRFIFVIDAWVPNTDPVRSVTFTLSGKSWGASFLNFGGNTKTVITDATTGADDDTRVYIDFIALSNAGPNTVTLKNVEVRTISGYASADTVSIGYYANSIMLGRGDDKLTMTGNGEIGYADMGRGNDTLTTGNGYLFSAAMGRGNDTVNVGTGDFGLIDLGRDADIVKFSANSGTGKIYAGEGISDDLAGARDFDTADFSAFTKALNIDLEAGTASTDSAFFEIRAFEKAIGGRGNDTIHGSDSADVLDGGAGLDKLYGHLGADIFLFEKGDTGSTRTTADTIYDFTSADSINLTRWDANSGKSGTQDFAFIGTKAFSGAAGELRYTKDTSDTWIEGDTNGDSKADFIIRLDDALKLTASNFDL